MQETSPTKVSKRKAREERLQQFEELAAFANLGDTPDEWRKFRLRWPEFFTGNLNRYIYDEAEIWHLQANLGGVTLREFESFCEKHSVYQASWENSDWEELSTKLKAATTHWRPLLLVYRDLLCSVWMGKDPHGSCLEFLYGLRKHVTEDLGVDPLDVENVTGVHCVPEDMRPSGNPVVDGTTGAITWEFGCQFQRDIYDLMQDRWRTMVCPQCRRYFIADKAAQKYCSPKCFGEMKQEKSLKYYYRKGRAKRQKAKPSRTESHRRKS